MKFDELIFYRQKIINFAEDKEVEYELLLRLRTSDGCYFPSEMFDEIVSDHEKHNLYLKRLDELLQEQLKKDDYTYSLNLDYQELYFDETVEFLRDFKYKNRLRIELTERLPVNCYDEENVLPLEAIKSIKEMGYAIALDDFLSGINHYTTLFVLNAYVDRVKISALDFNSYLSHDELQKFIFSIVNTIAFLEKEIVIEGVEEEEVLAAFPKEWLQQTYYYDRPHDF
ncbi:EAL domain-containing protein [Lactococcus garvieae]|uniref:EAL domain-containing protein n=1 Tax=Lactococcus garvieae TaxID=1363 RepID=UPI0018D745EB|nr:EAL domain-containing protein [Lactococcus garvieae]QPS70391.1 EAL domain-containing protein [Lactococcus garvieae]